jgi:hypothetical protein
MEIRNVKMAQKPPRICTFDLVLPKMGMTIKELALLETHGKKWISFPSRMYEDAGKKKYFPFVRIDEDKKGPFDQKVLELLEPLLREVSVPLQPLVEPIFDFPPDF